MSIQQEVNKLIEEVKKSYIEKDFIQKTKRILSKPNKYEVISSALIQVMRQLQIAGYPVYTRYLTNSGLNLNIAPDENVVKVAYGTMSDLMQYLPRVGPESFLDPLSSMVPEQTQNKINYHRLRTVRVYAKLLYQLHQRWIKISSNNMKSQDGFIVLLPKELRPQGYKTAQCWCEKPKTFIQEWQTPGKTTNKNGIRFKGIEEVEESEEQLLNYRSRLQHGQSTDFAWKQSLLDYQRSPKGRDLVALTQRAISQQNERVASVRFSELDSNTQRRIKSQFQADVSIRRSHQRHKAEQSKSGRSQSKRHQKRNEVEEKSSESAEYSYTEEYSYTDYSESERGSSSRKSVQHMKSRRASRSSRSKSSSGKGSPRSSGRRNQTLSPQHTRSQITVHQTNDYLRQQYDHGSSAQNTNQQGFTEQELMQRYKTNLDNTPANYSTTADISDTSMTQQQRKAAIMKDLGIDVPQNAPSTRDELSSLKTANKVEDFLPPEQKEYIQREKRLNDFIMNVQPAAQSSQIPADDLINKYSDPERSSGTNPRSVEHQYSGNQVSAASNTAVKEVTNMAKYDNAVFITDAIHAGSQPLSSTQRVQGQEPSAGYQPAIQTLESMSNMGQLYVRGGVKNTTDNSIMPQKQDNEYTSKDQINDLLGKPGYTDAPTYPVYHHKDVYSDYQKQHPSNFFSQSTTSGSDGQQQKLDQQLQAQKSPNIQQQHYSQQNNAFVQEQVSPIKQRIVVDPHSDNKSNELSSMPHQPVGIAQNNILSRDQIKQELSELNKRNNQFGEAQQASMAQASILSQQNAIKNLVEENDAPHEQTAMSVSVTPQTHTDMQPIAADTLRTVQQPKTMVHSVTPQDITNVVKSQTPIDYTTLAAKSQTPGDITTGQNYQTYEQNSIDVTSSEPNVDLSHARGRVFDSESEITQAGNLRPLGLQNPVLASTSVADPRQKQLGFADQIQEMGDVYKPEVAPVNVLAGNPYQQQDQIVPVATSSSSSGLKLGYAGTQDAAPAPVPQAVYTVPETVTSPQQSFPTQLAPVQPFLANVGAMTQQPVSDNQASSDYGTSNDLQKYTVNMAPATQPQGSSHSSGHSSAPSSGNNAQQGTAIQNPLQSSTSTDGIVPIQAAVSHSSPRSQLTYSKLTFQPIQVQPQAKSSAVQSSGLSTSREINQNDIKARNINQNPNIMLDTKNSISNIQPENTQKLKESEQKSQNNESSSSKSLKQASFMESQKKISSIMSQVTEAITSSAELLDKINKANQNINSQLLDDDEYRSSNKNSTEIITRKTQDLSELEKLQQQGQNLLNKLAQERLKDEIQSISMSIDVPKQGPSYLSTDDEERRKKMAMIAEQ